MQHRNPKREEFCQQFMVDMNGTAAARRAGYSEKSAFRIAYQLMEDPEVQARIEELTEARNTKTGITAERVIEELAKVGFATMRQFIRIDADGQPQIDLTETPDDHLDALSEIQTETVLEGAGEAVLHVRKSKIKLHDKLAALRLLANHTGALKEPEQKVADALTVLIDNINRRGSASPISGTRAVTPDEAYNEAKLKVAKDEAKHMRETLEAEMLRAMARGDGPPPFFDLYGVLGELIKHRSRIPAGDSPMPSMLADRAIQDIKEFLDWQAKARSQWLKRWGEGVYPGNYDQIQKILGNTPEGREALRLAAEIDNAAVRAAVAKDDPPHVERSQWSDPIGRFDE